MRPFLPSGYYYDLDDSYDESDEEEVRAHLRCVAEQPPLKLDTSSEVTGPPLDSGMLWAYLLAFRLHGPRDPQGRNSTG